MTEGQALRPHVQWFASAMEEKLRENDGVKTNWREQHAWDLLQHLKNEVEELEEALRFGPQRCPHNPDEDEVRREAADIGNLAMMLADWVCREVDEEPRTPPESNCAHVWEIATGSEGAKHWQCVHCFQRRVTK